MQLVDQSGVNFKRDGCGGNARLRSCLWVRWGKREWECVRGKRVEVWGETSEEGGGETGRNQNRPIFSTVGGEARGGRGLDGGRFLGRHGLVLSRKLVVCGFVKAWGLIFNSDLDASWLNLHADHSLVFADYRFIY